MRLQKAFRYRAYPNRAQQEAMNGLLETHRRLYNTALAERKGVYEAEQRTVTYGQQSAKLKTERRNSPQLALCNFSSCQRTLKRLERAFQAFFRRAKSGEKSGEKSKSGCFSSESNRFEKMAEPTGLEPATSDVTGRRSNQLNYDSAWEQRSEVRGQMSA